MILKRITHQNLQFYYGLEGKTGGRKFCRSDKKSVQKRNHDCVYWDSQASGVRGNLSSVVFGNSRFVAVGGGEIIYSICDQAGAANILNNQTFLRCPGAVFSKSLFMSG